MAAMAQEDEKMGYDRPSTAPAESRNNLNQPVQPVTAQQAGDLLKQEVLLLEERLAANTSGAAGAQPAFEPAKAGNAIRKMEAGFAENAFSYLMVLALSSTIRLKQVIKPKIWIFLLCFRLFLFWGLFLLCG